MNPLPQRTRPRRPPFLIFGGVVAFLFLLLGCTTPDFRIFSDPAMSTEVMQVELELLHEINLAVKDGDFDHSAYPMSVGVDPRNGKMLVEKFICWDACPDVGMVFLLYGSVETEEACAATMVGSPLISPEPIPGQYWGCRPIIDWLKLPARTP